MHLDVQEIRARPRVALIGKVLARLPEVSPELGHAHGLPRRRKRARERRCAGALRAENHHTTAKGHSSSQGRSRMFVVLQAHFVLWFSRPSFEENKTRSERGIRASGRAERVDFPAQLMRKGR
jgi:hypothetical protein